MNTIWMYWENTIGKSIPPIIDLCIKTIDKHKGGLTLNVLNPETIESFLPDLRPEWHSLKRAAHKADYIRTRLVHKYGGMWLDSDMIALRNLESLFNFPEEYDYACQNIGSSIGCFVARPGCKILGDVIIAQDKILTNNINNFQWNGIGNELLKKYGENYPYYQWPKWFLDEIAGGKISKLISKKETTEDNVSGNAVIFHLCNEASGPYLQKLNEKVLLNSNMLISQILRASFEIEAPNQKNSVISSFIRQFFAQK